MMHSWQVTKLNTILGTYWDSLDHLGGQTTFFTSNNRSAVLPSVYIRESGCNLMITTQRKCIYIIRISVCKKNVICMLQAELWINID